MMMTVNEIAKISGVSVRTLHYYDEIGLLKPETVTPAGYRLYDEAGLERLQQILLFRELELPLKDIKKIIDSKAFNRTRALEQQITLLKLKKEHTERLIAFAEQMMKNGGNTMDFKPFDKRKISDYTNQAKKQWGNTEAYKEFEAKNAQYDDEEKDVIADNFMQIFADIGALKDKAPESDEVQAKIKELKNYITEHYYTCTNRILASLGEMYIAGGEMTENIDGAGGRGTAQKTAEAIRYFTGG